MTKLPSSLMMFSTFIPVMISESHTVSYLYLYLLRYVLSIESAEELREYVTDLLQGNEGKKGQFIEDLITKWQKNDQELIPDSFQQCLKKDGKLMWLSENRSVDKCLALELCVFCHEVFTCSQLM